MDALRGLNLVSPYELRDNFFDAVDNGWMLITAGDEQNFNTMTASWGSFGILWNMPIAQIFIRPQRYTYQFVEQSSYYTLCFFDEKWRKALNFCGAKSGRKYDKPKETGLIPAATGHGIAFQQARMVLECRKLYADNLKPEQFIDKGIIRKNYPKSDFHRFFIGEIVNVYLAAQG
jgi:flavin reductase (DIM6/NTAB) family NADH-FMN oxidoreductase RutF